MKWWGRVNNWLFVAVVAAFAVFGVVMGVLMWREFGFAEFVNQIGMMLLFMFVLAAIVEAVRLVKYHKVTERWWLTFAVCLLAPLFVFGVMAASIMTVIAVFAPVVVMVSILLHKAVEAGLDRRAASK